MDTVDFIFLALVPATYFAMLVKFQQRYVNSHRILPNRRIAKDFGAFGRSQFRGPFGRSILGV